MGNRVSNDSSNETVDNNIAASSFVANPVDGSVPVSSSNTAISTMVPLSCLKLNDVKNLTLQDIQKYTDDEMKTEMAKFGPDAVQIKLLGEIKERYKYLLQEHYLCVKEDSLYTKIYSKHYRLTHPELNENRRQRKIPIDDDVNGFEYEYSGPKYMKHFEKAASKPHMWQHILYQVDEGSIVGRVTRPTKHVGGNKRGLLSVTFKDIASMSNREKNDVVAILGVAFARMKDVPFCHETAYVAHELLQEETHNTTRVMLIQFTPETEQGKPELVHSVGAAIFTPVGITWHKQNNTTTTIYPGKCKALNLVKIGILPDWKGYSLAGMTLQEEITTRLKQNGYNILIICGCATKFFRNMGIQSAPSWLEKPPFNLDPDDVDQDDGEFDEKKEEHNRNLFFFVPLDDEKKKFNKEILKRHRATGSTFSFQIKSSFIQGYYGIEGEGEHKKPVMTQSSGTSFADSLEEADDESNL